MVPTSQQAAIFENIANGVGHTMIQARAGCGKTSTIIEGLTHCPTKDVLLCAFNKSIERELAARAPKWCEVKTLHGFGLRNLSRALPKRPVIDADKTDPICKTLARNVQGEIDRDLFASLKKTISLAKGDVISSASGLDSLIDRHDVLIPETVERPRFVELVQDGLKQASENQGTIDFDDMIWMPVLFDIAVEQYSRVFGDEVQDWNPAQIRLAAKAVGSGARYCGVGDDKQAIYAFRGADKEAMARIKIKFACETFPLSVTFRCARAIVEVARGFVPDFTACDGAPDGIVRGASEDQMISQVRPGDFILSRTNAPLVRHCFSLLASGRRATIQGRDVGSKLAQVVRRTKADNMSQMLDRITSWKAMEIARLEKLERDVSAIIDTAECVFAISEGCDSVDSVLNKIATLFSDDGAGDSGRVVLSSTHKAKGLERDRVFLLRDTYLRGRRSKNEDGETVYDEPGDEEQNLFYVAVTRARQELVMVRGEKP